MLLRGSRILPFKPPQGPSPFQHVAIEGRVGAWTWVPVLKAAAQEWHIQLPFTFQWLKLSQDRLADEEAEVCRGRCWYWWAGARWNPRSEKGWTGRTRRSLVQSRGNPAGQVTRPCPGPGGSSLRLHPGSDPGKAGRISLFGVPWPWPKLTGSGSLSITLHHLGIGVWRAFVAQLPVFANWLCNCKFSLQNWFCKFCKFALRVELYPSNFEALTTGASEGDLLWRLCLPN